MQMVAKDGRYPPPHLKGYRGLTQGDSFYPMVFNVVLESVIWNWVTEVAPAEAGEEGIRETIQELVVLFYVDYGLVALPSFESLKTAFNVVTYLFDRLGILINVWKMTIKACRTFYLPGGFLESAYTRKVTGVGPSYQEILRRRVECPDCEVGLATGSMKIHFQGQNGGVQGDQGRLHPPTQTPWEDQTYEVSFLAALTHLQCPVAGYQGGGDHMDQTPGSLCAPPHEICNYYP